MANAIVHRDYTCPSDIQIRLEDDSLEVWSPGELPPPLQPESLYNPHTSVLRNPLIAQAFYFANIIERWGTGTTRIIDLCHNHELPEPEFVHLHGGLRVRFLKDLYTPEYLLKQGLSERQIQAVLYVKKQGKITNAKYQEIAGVKKRQASNDLKNLEDKGIFIKEGKTGRGTFYILKGQKRGKRGSQGATKEQNNQDSKIDA